MGYIMSIDTYEKIEDYIEEATIWCLKWLVWPHVTLTKSNPYKPIRAFGQVLSLLLFPIMLVNAIIIAATWFCVMFVFTGVFAAGYGLTEWWRKV